MFLAKLQTAITFALVIEIGHILYRFGVEFNFFCNVYYNMWNNNF